MRKTLLIIAFVVAGFLVESVWAEVFGRAWTPDVMIIMLVFFNLFRGIRSSLVVAIFAGALQDSYGVHVFGVHILAFVVCAYLTTAIKVYMYHPGSPFFRIITVFLVSTANVLLQTALREMSAPLDFMEVMGHVAFSEIAVTTVAAPYVFEKLKQCALKFFA